MATNEKKPGDLILERWMPNASHTEHEAARENLRALASFILRGATRRAEERYRQQIRMSEDQGIE